MVLGSKREADMQIRQMREGFFQKLILIFFTALLFFMDPNSVSYKMVCLLTWIDVGLTIWVFCSEEKVSLKNVKFLFLCITICFAMGQNLAYLFIVDPSEFGHHLIANNYSDLELCKGSIFTLEAFNFFVLGLTRKINFMGMKKIIAILALHGVLTISVLFY